MEIPAFSLPFSFLLFIARDDFFVLLFPLFFSSFFFDEKRRKEEVGKDGNEKRVRA